MSDSVAYFALHTRVGPTFVHILGRVSLRTGPSTCVCSEIGPYVGIRDTEILFAFCLRHVRQRREILSDSEQNFWALRAVIVAAAHVRVPYMNALLDAVYFLCPAADPDLPVRARISELFQLCPLRDHSRYGRLPQAFSREDNLVKLGKFSTHTSYALVL